MNDLIWYSSLATVALSIYWSMRKHAVTSFLLTALLVGCFLGFLIKGELIVLPWSSRLQAAEETMSSGCSLLSCIWR
jgi:hypothetical protein